MKKKIFGSIAIVAIAAVAAFNVSVGLNSQNEELSAVTLANVEALAQETTMPKDSTKIGYWRPITHPITGVTTNACLPSGIEC